MNVRKPVDFSAMYAVLGEILAQDLPQMEEVCAIGRAVSQRPEKGAAVAAAEYLQANFPERTGFSPRNVRRMRDFYRTYENDQTLLRLAMKIGWTLNVVVMEVELTREQQIICFRRAATEKLSKKKLLEIILNKEFADGPIDEPDRTYYNIANPGERRTELTILEPQRCQAKTHRTVKQCTATERKRDVVQCGRRRRSLILTLYCCVLAFNSPSTVCRFPYFQAWLGSS